MNRFITALPKTLIAAGSLFQTALPVANLGLARAIRKRGTIVKMIWRRPQAAAIAIRPAKVLMIGITLGALLTMPNFVQGAKAQQSNSAREQASVNAILWRSATRMIHMKGPRPGAGSSFTKPAWPITARWNDSD